MISLYGWRYENVVKTKVLSRCEEKQNLKKIIVRPVGRFSYHIVYVLAALAQVFITVLAAIASFSCLKTAHLFWWMGWLYLYNQLANSFVPFHFKFRDALLSGLRTFYTMRSDTLCFNFNSLIVSREQNFVCKSWLARHVLSG